LALLTSDQAQQMQRIRVLRRFIQDALIERLGITQLSGPMLYQRLFQSIFYRPFFSD
jgi:hypothetical protein